MSDNSVISRCLKFGFVLSVGGFYIKYRPRFVRRLWIVLKENENVG